jgi:[ribosomal protein S18]-alanine N-acetyltransferase
MFCDMILRIQNIGYPSMTITNTDISDGILVELRKIVRAMDLQSRQLQRNCALTSPQLVVLREILRHDEISIGALAARASLSNATLTGIVDRLEQRGLTVRKRGKDRRQVLLCSTESGRVLCENAPPLMQEKFLCALSGLQQWEQAQMLAALSRLSTMMNGGPPPGRESEEIALSEDGFIATCQMLLERESETERVAQSMNTETELIEIHSGSDFPQHITRESLADWLHEHLRPYEDKVEDILAGLGYALSASPGKGGFIVLALLQGKLVGALVILNTGMSGYVPEHLLLFVAVDGAMRGNGIGGKLIRRAQALCSGNMKLHVEYDNPAKRLYERMGFKSKYADMRWINESCNDKS